MNAEQAETMEVLREVWRSQGQDTSDLDEDCNNSAACKKLEKAGVGFGGANEEDRAMSWKARLESEGKAGGTSLGAFVLGNK
jgi:hypothetical protein